MRFLKGSINVGERQDYPLLQQVMESQFITHSQLFQFLKRNGRERSRSSFCWRIKRLVDGRFLERHILPIVHSDFVYSLTASGITYLQGKGAIYSGPAEGPTIRSKRNSIAHAIAMNTIRLRLTQSDCVVMWQSEVEIRAYNELTRWPYAKDYDGIVMLRLGDRMAIVALEYERTAKAWRVYRDIRKAIESEHQVDRFLLRCNEYICSGVFKSSASTSASKRSVASCA